MCAHTLQKSGLQSSTVRASKNVLANVTQPFANALIVPFPRKDAASKLMTGFKTGATKIEINLATSRSLALSS